MHGYRDGNVGSAEGITCSSFGLHLILGTTHGVYFVIVYLHQVQQEMARLIGKPGASWGYQINIRLRTVMSIAHIRPSSGFVGKAASIAGHRNGPFCTVVWVIWSFY